MINNLSCLDIERQWPCQSYRPSKLIGSKFDPINSWKRPQKSSYRSTRSVVLFFLRTVYLSVFNGSKMNVAHGVCEIADVKESFGAKPGSVSPAESFAKSVVRCNDIPMACSIRNVHRTFWPIVWPLWNLDPHHCSEEQRNNRTEHLIPRRPDIVMGFYGFETFELGPIESKCLKNQLQQPFRSAIDLLLGQQITCRSGSNGLS